MSLKLRNTRGRMSMWPKIWEQMKILLALSLMVGTRGSNIGNETRREFKSIMLCLLSGGIVLVLATFCALYVLLSEWLLLVMLIWIHIWNPICEYIPLLFWRKEVKFAMFTLSPNNMYQSILSLSMTLSTTVLLMNTYVSTTNQEPTLIFRNKFIHSNLIVDNCSNIFYGTGYHTS